MNTFGLSLTLSHVLVVFKNTYNIHTQEHQKKPVMDQYIHHLSVFETQWTLDLCNHYSYMVLCAFIILFSVFKSSDENEATYVAILSENDVISGEYRPAMPCNSRLIQTHDKYQAPQDIHSGETIAISRENTHVNNWTFFILKIQASLWNCDLLWECIVHFFQILGVPLAVPLYVVWAFISLRYDTPPRPTAPGVTKHHLVTLRDGCVDFCKRVRLGFSQGLILVVRSSVVSSSMDISMMIVLAAMFVVQCDRKWSNNVPITDGSRYNVTLQDMSHLSSRNASAPVTLVILHIDTVNFAFHYCTVLSRVLMELVIAMYTMNAHEHGVKVLCLVRVVSFAYFLQLWKAPFGFLFTYNRGSVLLKAWVGFSGSSVQSLWNSWKKTFHWLNLPEYIFECTSALFVKAWEWNLTMFTFMTESPPADATVQTSKMPVDMVMTVFMTQVSEITTIIRTNIVMICIMLLLIIWMSAPYENEGARRLFRRYIFNPKLPWLLSASNTRYLHLICVAVSGLVYYESWGLNRSPDKLSHTPLSFLQMSIADTIIAACIVFLCFMSRILQFFFPRVGISINMSPDSVLQLGSSSEDGYDVVLVTSTTQTVFGNLDRKDYYVETIAFPCKLD